jgi:CubicO group peptidase (beta-lactamase class C family)
MTIAPAPTGLDAPLAELEVELSRWQVPGLQIAAVRGGAVLYAGGVGVRDVHDQRPVDAQTLFDHGSCGKAYTGLLAALLHEEGVLDLDAPVRTYVPELALPDAVLAERITTRDLLSHRSGLGRHDFTWILNSSWSGEELVRRLAHLPLAGDLRAEMIYSNLGYTLAGVASARVTGSTWADQVRERVLVPAGMTQTLTDADAFMPHSQHATPHIVRDSAITETAYRMTAGIAPAGQIMPPATDAAQWLLLHTGASDINPAAIDATHRLHIPMPPEGSPHELLELLGYGLGWVVMRFRDLPLLWHSGGVDGFRTDMLVLPRQRIGVLVSGNVFPSLLPMAAVLQIADRLLGYDDVHWYDELRKEPADAEPATPTASQSGPTHPLTEYAGSYSDPGYGELAVTVQGGDLKVRIGEEDLTTTHRHFDTWDLRYEPLAAGLTVTFVVDAEGLVREAVVPLEDDQPTRFRRLGDDR